MFLFQEYILLYFSSMISIILPFHKLKLFSKSTISIIRRKVFDEMPEPHRFLLRITFYVSQHNNHFWNDPVFSFDCR